MADLSGQSSPSDRYDLQGQRPIAPTLLELRDLLMRGRHRSFDHYIPRASRARSYSVDRYYVAKTSEVIRELFC